MKIKFLLFIYILILNYRYCESLEFIISVDLNSNVSYVNYECGTTQNIIVKENILMLDDTKFPPCKSIADAGYRSRQLYFRDDIYYDLSIVIEFINFDWNNTIIGGREVYFGDYYYCGFEIRVKDEPNAIISIDGKDINNSYKHFLRFDLNTYDRACVCNVTNITFKNIKFINWSEKIIIYIPNNIRDHNIVFNSVSTVNSPHVIDTVNNYSIKNGKKMNLSFKNCKFLNANLYGTDRMIVSQGSLTIDNCTFDNIKTEYDLVALLDGNGSIKNTTFNKVTSINIDTTLIFSFDSSFDLNNVVIENSTFRNLFAPQFNKTQSPIKLQNIYINNNNIPYGTLYGGIFTIFSYYKGQYPSTIYYFDNIILNNNKIEYLKYFIKSFGPVNINLSNTTIPYQFQIGFKVDHSNIYINENLSSIKSVSFCDGINNEIYININKSDISNEQSNHILNDCIDCTINYLNDNNDDSSTKPSSLSSSSSSTLPINETQTSSLNINNTIINEDKIKMNSNHNSNNKKKFIIPIVIIGFVLLSITITGLIFKSRIKSIFNNSNNNYNNNDTEADPGISSLNSNDNPLVVGEIVINEIANSENDAAESN